MPRLEIGHLAGEELDIGAADSNPFDVDDDLPRARYRCQHFLHRALFRRGQDVRAHGPGVHVRST
jgi:hypothetical protein